MEAKPEHYQLASRNASLGVGHIWTEMACPAYRTYDPAECTCRAYGHYIKACEAENLDHHNRHMWMIHDCPSGPIG